MSDTHRPNDRYDTETQCEKRKDHIQILKHFPLLGTQSTCSMVSCRFYDMVSIRLTPGLVLGKHSFLLIVKLVGAILPMVPILTLHRQA